MRLPGHVPQERAAQRIAGAGRFIVTTATAPVTSLQHVSRCSAHRTAPPPSAPAVGFVAVVGLLGLGAAAGFVGSFRHEGPHLGHRRPRSGPVTWGGGERDRSRGEPRPERADRAGRHPDRQPRRPVPAGGRGAAPRHRRALRGHQAHPRPAYRRRPPRAPPRGRAHPQRGGRGPGPSAWPGGRAWSSSATPGCPGSPTRGSASSAPPWRPGWRSRPCPDRRRRSAPSSCRGWTPGAGASRASCPEAGRSGPPACRPWPSRRARRCSTSRPTGWRGPWPTLAHCGADRPVAVGRELTKLHEEVWRGTLAEAVAKVGSSRPGANGSSSSPAPRPGR